ncbi:MAG: DUF4350 domain-containing protein [bacterium]
MGQKLTIFVTIVLVVGVLIVINAATYESKEDRPDNEVAPNRSTYHAGPTGTRALYDLLSESGYRVMRWREVPGRLLSDNQLKVETFVVVGDTPLAFDQEEAESLLLWVAAGGRLVLVDRNPEARLLPASGEWKVDTELSGVAPYTVDPAKTDEMTANVKPVHPVQPTLLTQNVDAVLPSRLAAAIRFAPKTKEKAGGISETVLGNDGGETAPAPEPGGATNPVPASPAPVVHLADSRGALLLDYPHGAGRIIVLSDPYIFSNGGIQLQDNLQLALNMLTNTGLIAFDEYHQGRGTTRNAIAAYFSGTPILPVVGQIALLVLLVLWTRSRRFARPLPLPFVDRRSSLEFVASMAELQQRARAFDLALENIYSRTRRVLARYAGMDYNSPRSEIASRVAARSVLEAHSLEVLMRQCEEVINGAPLTERKAILLAKRLRDLESTLGLRLRSRDAKQATRRS